MVEELNGNKNWQLSATAVDEYAAKIAELVYEHVPDDRMQIRCEEYHNDRVLVRTLLDPDDAAHKEAWEKIFQEVSRIVYWKMKGKEDVLLEADDFIQIANIQVIKSVRTFQFNSLFSTWLAKVVMNTMIQARRDGFAKKRSATTTQLDDNIQDQKHQQPEEQVNQKALVDLIRQVLAKHPDKRLQQIFLLAKQNDRTTHDIGQLLGLSSARIRALLSQAKSLLKSDPAIQAWISSTEHKGTPENTGESDDCS
ncbi:MAG TPA: sigma-70 family RNA polymerase sigma factor [Roseiflexaceae bacterium]|nr:sigma-70 family RNA polymerase sigma factor [Roseiflexaceae bacterium]